MVDFDSCQNAGERVEMFLHECEKLRRLAKRGIKENQGKLNHMKMQLDGLEFDSVQRRILGEYINDILRLADEENDKAYYDGINDAMVFLLSLMACTNQENEEQ